MKGLLRLRVRRPDQVARVLATIPVKGAAVTPSARPYGLWLVIRQPGGRPLVLATRTPVRGVMPKRWRLTMAAQGLLHTRHTHFDGFEVL